MAQQQAYFCDGCGDLLHGYVKNKLVHKDYLSLRNANASLQMQTKQTFKLFYIFITKPPSQDLSFCMKPGWPCLQQYIDRKVGENNFRREQALRREATEQHLTRTALGYDPAPRGPRPGDPEWNSGNGAMGP